ncbi:MAG TPA: hypothetical protein VIU41_05760, partial [Geobacteraceae bacterium]
MSLILDALRKMEEERKARRGGTVDIRPIVLGQRRQPVTPARSRLIPAGIGLLLLAGGIGAGLFLLGRSPSSPPQPAAEPARASVPAVQAPAQSVPLPAPALAVPVRPEPLPAAPATPAAKPRPAA